MTSQAKQILELLKRGESISPLEALQKFNCMRLGARIKDLRDEGHKIQTLDEKRNGKRYARYKLHTQQLL